MAGATAEQELRAELLKKDRELIEAAQVGQELLDENAQLLSKFESVKEDCIYYKQVFTVVYITYNIRFVIATLYTK